MTNVMQPLTPANILATTSTDYCGNVIYENGALGKILTGEGYITLSGATPTYHYFLKDHQGNNRVVINQGGTVEQVNHYYPFGGLFGESTAGGVQPYKYNGKELDRIHGLDLYDYGARHYDAQLGRFHTQDRFSEKYNSLSNYSYGANNSINNIDVNGDSIWVNYVDQNNQNQRLLYTLGMQYEGKDAFVSTVISALNDMGGTKNGKTVLSALSGSENNYDFTNTYAKDDQGNEIKDALAFIDKTGQIHAGALMNKNVQYSQKIESAAHELFHGYQNEFGETGATINREIGAYLFGRSIAANLGYGTLGFGNFTSFGTMYENAMINLMYSLTFSQQNYNAALSRVC